MVPPASDTISRVASYSGDANDSVRLPIRECHPLCLVSIQTERTCGRLRYSLGGDRPSQTARLALSMIFKSMLGLQIIKGGIPTSAPKILAYLILRLPPILYIIIQNPIPGCSKAPVSGSLSLRSRGSFHLSLTVLDHYRSLVYI